MLRLFLCVLITVSLSFHAAAQEESAGPAVEKERQIGEEEISPSDIFQLAARLRNEIELIRLEMGKPESGPPVFQVENAAPREVYFQALTLFRKADRLAFEHTREQIDEPVAPEKKIRQADVYAIVELALDRVERVKETLNIPEPAELPPVDPAIDPSQVLNSIVAANRELNHLLDQQFAPGDVYWQVSVAIAYASRLLDTPGEVSTPPEAPALERRKRPADVYRKLVECFGQIREIGESSGVPMLKLVVAEQQVERAAPSDVYDVASLLVSELAHLHELRAQTHSPRQVFNPGRKLPSDVFQRTGILCRQMEILKSQLESETGPAE
jgi:hypothetical protein